MNKKSILRVGTEENVADLRVGTDSDGSVFYNARFVGVTMKEKHAILDLVGPDAPLEIKTRDDELAISGHVTPDGISDRMKKVLKLVLPDQVHDILAR